MTVGPAVPLQSCPSSLSADASGAVHVLARSRADGRWRASVSSIDAAGALSVLTSLSRKEGAQNAMRAVMTPDGLTAAYETGQPKPEPFEITELAGAASPEPAASAARATREAKPRVSVATLGTDGRTRTQLLSHPGRRAELHHILSRGGTTAVTFRESVPRQGWLQYWVAIRPAGAKVFRPAVSMKSALRPTFTDDDVVLGDDGSGIITSTPSSAKKIVSARRIGRDGRIGRAIVIGKRPADYATTKAAVGADGTVTVAVVDTARRGGDGPYGLFVSLLTPGAAAFTTPRLVYTGRTVTAQLDRDFAIATDGAGRTTVVTGKESSVQTERGLQIYTGRGDDLAPAQAVFAPGAIGVALTPMADGGTALTYRSYVGAPADPRDERYAHQIAFGRSDGTWATPEPFSAPFAYDYEASVRGVTALPGGGIAVARALPRPEGGRIACVLERLTP